MATKPTKTTRPKLRRRSASKAKPKKIPLLPNGEARPKGMLLGYARVSTLDQNLALQRHALTEAGCEKIFNEQLS
jgi:resolvase-like protein